MKKNFRLLLIVIVGAAFAACSGFGNKPEFRLSDLQGLWLEDKANIEHYVRFTTEQSDEAGYLFGREWHAEQDVKETDLYVYVKDSLGNDSLIHGNGWFQYALESNGQLTEIHFMENGGAEIPKVYVVSMLTDTRLEYYNKEYPEFKSYFNRADEVVESND